MSNDMMSNLLSLPNELIIEVFAHLPYWDLKRRIPLVNKRFNAMVYAHYTNATGTGNLARALFRDSPIGSVTNKIEYEIHPILSSKNLTRLTTGKWLYNSHVYGIFNDIVELPIAKDNAVSPAVTQMIIRQEWGYRDWPHFHVFSADRTRGVTVMDVLKGIDDIFKLNTEEVVDRGAVAKKHEQDWEDWMDRRRVLERQRWEWAGAEVFGVYQGVFNLVVEIGMHVTFR